MNASIVVLIDRPYWGDDKAHRALAGYWGTLLFNQFHKAGALRRNIRVEALCERIPPQGNYYFLEANERIQWELDCRERLEKLSPNIIIAVGQQAMRAICEPKYSSIQKWHSSIIESTIKGIKCMPVLHPEYILKVYKDMPLLTASIRKAVEQSHFPEIRNVARKLLYSLPIEANLAKMEHLTKAEQLSIDIETAAGQIVCVGFSADPTEALCVPTLPNDYSNPDDFYRIWKAIDRLCRSTSRKIAQNGIYDWTYLSRYGVRVRNFYHDTMIAQKFLNCELPMGLDTIARLYTNEPYWKDDAKDWTTKRDKSQLYRYNCLDASVTLEAAIAQQLDLRKRNLDKPFYDFVMQLTAPIAQMSWTGLPIDIPVKDILKTECESRVKSLNEKLQYHAKEIIGKEINPRSPIQVKALLKAHLPRHIRLPFKRGKETSDLEALYKLKSHLPNDPILQPLIDISRENKKLSSYLNYKHDADNRVRYTMFVHGTETGRMACKKDPWNRGFNVQTVPAGMKAQFMAPAGCRLIEVDLKQAESRFVAWDAPEPTLMNMYKQGIDIHRFVASHAELFNKPMDKVSKLERQLGKKVGHAANYGMGSKRLVDICLKEMDYTITPDRATRMLEGYHQIFPGIRRWQNDIRNEVRQTRKLKTFFLRERVFYNRECDDLWREAYAYKPQSTVPDCINKLILWLFGFPGTTLLAQIHDSVLLEVTEQSISPTLQRIKQQDEWNPEMRLRGGLLRIPIEIKIGRRWNELKEIYNG